MSAKNSFKFKYLLFIAKNKVKYYYFYDYVYLYIAKKNFPIEKNSNGITYLYIFEIGLLEWDIKLMVDYIYEYIYTFI